MKGFWILVRVLVATVLVLSAAALWSATDNPTVTTPNDGDRSCLAPWDVVLNDANATPGGEHVDDAEAERLCRQVAESRFDDAMVLGAASGFLSVVTMGVAGLALLARHAPRRPEVESADVR